MTASRKRIDTMVVILVGSAKSPISYIKNLTSCSVFRQAKILFATDATFNELTRKGHTNIASYITGMSLGYLVYRWQKDNVNFEKYKVIR